MPKKGYRLIAPVGPRRAAHHYTTQFRRDALLAAACGATALAAVQFALSHGGWSRDAGEAPSPAWIAEDPDPDFWPDVDTNPVG